MTGTRNSSVQGAWRTLAVFVAGAIVGAVSAVQVVPDYRGTSVGKKVDSLSPYSANLPSGGVPNAARSATALGEIPAIPAEASNLKCLEGQNGGSTDQGVTAKEIRLATTVVESGIGRPFLRDVRFAMEAVKNAVNAGGGVCGRLLSIQYVDDGWDPQKGAQYLRNFLYEPDPAKKIFAIPIGPSSEGVKVVIDAGDLDRAQIPLVGADGMLKEEYVRDGGTAQPWVWPVAAATVASARIMARDAYNKGAKSFGIVFDKNYRFGQEAAQAFNAEVKRLTHNSVLGYNKDNNCQQRYCGIQAGLSSYPNEVHEFYRQAVDFTALFLEPQTALTWMSDPNSTSASTDYPYPRYGGAQPLFTREFGNNCKDKCDGMIVWTGFKPFIESSKSDPAVQKFVTDMQNTNPQADVDNAFAVGGYVGMQLLVEALQKVGPYLTRGRLQYELDHMTFASGLTLQPKLEWRPGWRWVNTTMQGFTILYKSAFGGWREGSVVHDPSPSAGTD